MKSGKQKIVAAMSAATAAARWLTRWAWCRTSHNSASQLKMGLGVMYRLGDDESVARHGNERRDCALMERESAMQEDMGIEAEIKTKDDRVEDLEPVLEELEVTKIDHR